MSLTIILLIAIPVVLMVLMHSVGHGGRRLGRPRTGHDHGQLGATQATGGGNADNPDNQGHHHGRRGGCC